jgi:hypothetical protein
VPTLPPELTPEQKKKLARALEHEADAGVREQLQKAGKLS